MIEDSFTKNGHDRVQEVWALKNRIWISFVAALLTGALLLSGCGTAPAGLPVTEPTPSPAPCEHAHYEAGICTVCGAACSHEERHGDGTCKICGMPCEHVFENHVCTVCGKKIRHEAHNPDTQLCTECGYFLPHSYENGACIYCGKSPDFVTGTLSRKFLVSSPMAGTVETVEYTAGDHGTGKGDTPKELQVYVPGDYDPARKYDVVLLLHGLGEDERSWLTASRQYDFENGDFLRGADLLDKMHELGLFGDVIVVSATYFRDRYTQGFNKKYDYPGFLEEIEEDILPAVICRYSTWADGPDTESVIAARDHFALAGFSMGAYIITGGVLAAVPELFGWYGTYSGNDGDPRAVAKIIDAAAERGYPIRFWYNCAGELDVARPYQRTFLELCLQYSASLAEGENVVYQDIPMEHHNYHVWFNGLYNSLLVFFRWNTEGQG